MTQPIAFKQEPNNDLSPQRIDRVNDHPALVMGSASATVAESGPVCEQCQGAGWLKEAVPYEHPNFGVLLPCACTLMRQSQRKADERARLSNLDAFVIRPLRLSTHSSLVYAQSYRRCAHMRTDRMAG